MTTLSQDGTDTMEADLSFLTDFAEKNRERYSMAAPYLHIAMNSCVPNFRYRCARLSFSKFGAVGRGGRQGPEEIWCECAVQAGAERSSSALLSQQPRDCQFS